MYHSSFPYYSASSRAMGSSGIGRTYDYTRPTGYISPTIVHPSPNYSVGASSTSHASGASSVGGPAAAVRDPSNTTTTTSTSSGRSSGDSGVGRTYEYTRPTGYSGSSVRSSYSPSSSTGNVSSGSRRSGTDSRNGPSNTITTISTSSARASGDSGVGRTYEYTRPTGYSGSSVHSSYSPSSSRGIASTGSYRSGADSATTPSITITTTTSTSSGRSSGDSGASRTHEYTRPTTYAGHSVHSSYSPSHSRGSGSSGSFRSGTDSGGGASTNTITSSARSERASEDSGGGRTHDYTRPTGYSGSPVHSSYSSSYRSGTDSGSGPRAEAETVRCSRLGDGVEGRTNVVSNKEFFDKNKALSTDTQKKSALQLIPTAVNLHVEANRRLHHTDKFEHSNLIVRRGQPFDVIVTFNRAYDAKQDNIILQFVIGNRPQESKGSIIRVPLSRNIIPNAWSCKIKQASSENVSLHVSAPANAAVGRYSLYVETKTKSPGSGKAEQFRYKHPDELFILFNPWCKDDSVYLDQEAMRQEYVLNDSGLIWVGTAAENCGMPWNYGQFEDVSLNSCLWLMDHAQLATAARGNPVRVTRCISAMANYNDQDGGVLFGRWSKDYPKDTTPPTAWPGSVAILEKFWQKKNVVKFAQCWVFSGLVTSLLRAIGIPTRPVTNFASAHDVDASMTIDFHFDEEGKPLSELNDSVWNFHVWNESFFKRPDLPDGYDGWQAHDATPQEVSYGVFRCGPTSVNAVKQGAVYLPFDTSFVFAEVNGDKVFWEVKDDGSMEVMQVDKKSIGKMISTKAVGKNVREDITQNYKHPEGSVAERRAVDFAYKFSSRKDQSIYKLPTGDVKFTLDVPNEVEIGKDVTVALKIRNAAYINRTIKGKITVMIGFYTGITCKDLKDENFEIDVEPRQEKTVILDVPASLYVSKCEADGGLKIYVKASVKENGQRFATYDTVDFLKPELTMELVRGNIRVNRDFEAKISFINPLPVKITGGQWFIEASGANPKSKVIPNAGTIPPGKEVQTTVKLSPYRVGALQVCAAFTSSVISGVRGACSIDASE